MPKYRTAIIATGIIARVHARGWLGVPERPVEIATIADTNAEALREFGDFFEVREDKRYKDYREMLDVERPDFVDVCSWHQLHAEMVIAAAARRPRAIICQKPMAVDLGEANEMMVACERNQVRLVIAYQRPHHAVWLKARDLLRDGIIGKIHRIEVDDSGNMLNTNSHNIRLALFLMDEPQVEWVMGTVERITDLVERGLPAEDASLGIAACSNGVSILIHGNLIKGIGQGCRVFGTDGLMELSTSYHPNSKIPSDAPMYMPEMPSARYNFEIGKACYMNASSNGWREIEAPWHDCWAHQCQETIDWVENKVEEPISSGDRGRSVQEVMMALYESTRKRQRIYLPLKTLINPLRLMVENGDLSVEWPGLHEIRSGILRGEDMK